MLQHNIIYINVSFVASFVAFINLMSAYFLIHIEPFYFQAILSAIAL